MNWNLVFNLYYKLLIWYKYNSNLFNTLSPSYKSRNIAYSPTFFQVTLMSENDKKTLFATRKVLSSAQYYEEVYRTTITRDKSKFGGRSCTEPRDAGERLEGPRATDSLSATSPRSPIIYKRFYIPIYIFTRTHTYLTFFPFHIVYSSYVKRGQCGRRTYVCSTAI